jgi:hypothetical protein
MQAACVFAEKRAAALDATDYAFAPLNLFANLYTTCLPTFTHTKKLPFLCYFFSAFQWF